MSTRTRNPKRHAIRRGGLPPMVVVMLGSILALALLAFALSRLRSPSNTLSPDAQADTPLLLYCAAGIQPAITEVAHRYLEEYGIAIDIQYGGSGTLLGQIEINPRGDLYIAADNSYILLGQDKGLLAEASPLATQHPVIAVAQGNPKNIGSLRDFLRPEISFGLANPDAAAIGSVTRAALLTSGIWDDIERASKVFKPTVNELANDIKIGTIDAAIIWDCNAAQVDGVHAIEVPELSRHTRSIAIAILTASEQPENATHFARYVAAQDRGGESFDKLGYGSLPRDTWTDQPKSQTGGSP